MPLANDIALPHPKFSPHNPYWREQIEGLPDVCQPRNNAQFYLYAWTWELNNRRDVDGMFPFLFNMMQTPLYQNLYWKQFRNWLRSNWRTISSTQGESINEASH